MLLSMTLPAGVGAADSTNPAPVATTSHWTQLATRSRTVVVRAAPAGAVVVELPPLWHGGRLSLPIVAQRGGWLDVRLPGRPNGSTGWIVRSTVSISRTPYEIVIDLAARHLALFRLGHLVMDAPAGIGTSNDPTPTGNFFVALLAEAPSPAWGPFVMVTSAHSNSITDWELSGDALVAIHGPLGADAQIGTTGAAVSHGCVRLHVNDLERLRVVPIGSPIVIDAT